MPTGDVNPNEDNLREWFNTCVGMGSKLVQKDWVEAGEFDKITTLTTETLKLI